MTLYEFIIQVIDIKLNSPSLYPILSITLQLLSPIITSFLYPDAAFDFKEFYKQLKQRDS